MEEYATLTDLKKFLSLGQIDNFDGKLDIILVGVNAKVAEYTDGAQKDSTLRLAACLWAESIWRQEEAKEGIPSSIERILNQYIDEDEGEIVVELI